MTSESPDPLCFTQTVPFHESTRNWPWVCVVFGECWLMCFSSTFFFRGCIRSHSWSLFLCKLEAIKGRAEYFCTGSDQEEFQDKWIVPTPELNAIQPWVGKPYENVWVSSGPAEIFYWISAGFTLPYFLGHWING